MGLKEEYDELALDLAKYVSFMLKLHGEKDIEGIVESWFYLNDWRFTRELSEYILKSGK